MPTNDRPQLSTGRSTHVRVKIALPTSADLARAREHNPYLWSNASCDPYWQGPHARPSSWPER
jgi:hypothetical protein